MSGDNGLEVLARALEAADACKVRVMVHISKTAPTPEVLNSLRPGDILTHCFQGRGDGLLAEWLRDSGSRGSARARSGLRRRPRLRQLQLGHGEAGLRALLLSGHDQHRSASILDRALVYRYAHHDVQIPAPRDAARRYHSQDHLEARLRDRPGAQRSAPCGRARLPMCSYFPIEEGEFPLEDTHLKVVTASRRIRPRRIMRGGVWENGDCASPLRPLHECDYEVFRTLEESA